MAIAGPVVRREDEVAITLDTMIIAPMKALYGPERQGRKFGIRIEYDLRPARPWIDQDDMSRPERLIAIT